MTERDEPFPCEPVELTDFRPRPNVSDEQADREIIDFVAEHPGSDTFDMATGLQLPFALVERTVERLVRQGVLREGGNVGRRCLGAAARRRMP